MSTTDPASVVSAAAASAAADPQTVIASDLSCMQCGYNLRTLAADGRCPECGVPVAHTVEMADPMLADTEWFDRMRQGVTLRVVLMPAGVAWSFAIAILMRYLGVTVSLYWLHHGRWVSFLLETVTPAMLVFWPIWLIAWPRRHRDGTVDRLVPRRLLRGAIAGATLLSLTRALHDNIFYVRVYPYVEALEWSSYLIWSGLHIATIFLVLTWLMQLARPLGAIGVARWMQVLRWLHPALLVLTAIISCAPLYLSEARHLDLMDSLQITAIALGLLLALATLLQWVQLIILRQRMARMRRAGWWADCVAGAGLGVQTLARLVTRGVRRAASAAKYHGTQ